MQKTDRGYKSLANDGCNSKENQGVQDQVEKASVAALLVWKMVSIAIVIVWTLRKVDNGRADPEDASVVTPAPASLVLQIRSFDASVRHHEYTPTKDS